MSLEENIKKEEQKEIRLEKNKKEDNNNNNSKTDYERSLEQVTGKTIEYLRETPIDEQRRELEKEEGPLKFKSYFPLIGRSRVLSDRMVSHEEAEKAYQKAIKIENNSEDLNKLSFEDLAIRETNYLKNTAENVFTLGLLYVAFEAGLEAAKIFDKNQENVLEFLCYAGLTMVPLAIVQTGYKILKDYKEYKTIKNIIDSHLEDSK